MLLTSGRIQWRWLSIPETSGATIGAEGWNFHHHDLRCPWTTRECSEPIQIGGGPVGVTMESHFLSLFPVVMSNGATTLDGTPKGLTGRCQVDMSDMSEFYWKLLRRHAGNSKKTRPSQIRGKLMPQVIADLSHQGYKVVLVTSGPVREMDSPASQGMSGV